MWILQRLIILLAFAAVLFFIAWNVSESVDVKYWFGAYNVYENVPLPVIMILFFIVGMLFYYLFSIPREWRLRSEIRRLRRGSQSRERELAQLRNIALADDDIEPEAALSGKEEEVSGS